MAYGSRGSRGVVRGSRPPGPPKPYKITRADYRPRTRPGFYQRGGDVLRIDFVEFSRPLPGKHLTPYDWYVSGVGTLTEVDKGGPSPGTQATSVEMKVYELTGGRDRWRRMNPAKLKPAWKAFFDRHPKFTED